MILGGVLPIVGGQSLHGHSIRGTDAIPWHEIILSTYESQGERKYTSQGGRILIRIRAISHSAHGHSIRGLAPQSPTWGYLKYT